MNRLEELHNDLASIPKGYSMRVTEEEFIYIYGNSIIRSIWKKKTTKANELAKKHNLSAAQKGVDYIFTREV